MQMPEMNPRLAFMMETKSDQLNELVNQEREACYAAGKADALPTWPPEGEFSKDGKGRYKFENNEWWVFMTTMWGAFQNCRGSNEMTATYFLGKLEKVNE